MDDEGNATIALEQGPEVVDPPAEITGRVRPVAPRKPHQSHPPATGTRTSGPGGRWLRYSVTPGTTRSGRWRGPCGGRRAGVTEYRNHRPPRAVCDGKTDVGILGRNLVSGDR